MWFKDRKNQETAEPEAARIWQAESPPDDALSEKEAKAAKKRADKQTQQLIDMGRGFEKTLVDKALASARHWRRFGFGCLAVAGLSAAAVMGLTPLKSVEPFVARVNETTGAVDVITTIKNKQMHYGEVIDKYWLAEYVRFREGYDWHTIQSTYDATLLMSAPDVQVAFKALYNSPNAPHKVLKQQSKIVVKVTNISFIGDTAQVRFEKQTLPSSGQTEDPVPPQKMIATIAFEFKSTPMTENDRLVNPLGFQVLSYRVDPEAAP